MGKNILVSAITTIVILGLFMFIGHKVCPGVGGCGKHEKEITVTVEENIKGCPHESHEGHGHGEKQCKGHGEGNGHGEGCAHGEGPGKCDKQCKGHGEGCCKEKGSDDEHAMNMDLSFMKEDRKAFDEKLTDEEKTEIARLRAVYKEMKEAGDNMDRSEIKKAHSADIEAIQAIVKAHDAELTAIFNTLHEREDIGEQKNPHEGMGEDGIKKMDIRMKAHFLLLDFE